MQIVGASFDTREENADFAKKNRFDFPLLCDTDHKIGLAYGAASDPKDEYAQRIAYVIDENGKVAQAYPKVDARNFPKELLGKL